GAVEVDRLGVRRLPARRVHRPRTHRRPHAGDLAHRAVALRRDRGRGLGGHLRRRGGADDRGVRHPSLEGVAADIVRDGFGGVDRLPRVGRDPAGRAQQTPLRLRPRPVRHRQQRRGLSRRRPPVRVDRGHRAPGRRPRAGTGMAAVSAGGPVGGAGASAAVDRDAIPTLVIDGCAVATVDAAGTEYRTGHVVLHGNRIGALGPGPAPAVDAARIDGRGCLLTPGLVNTHNHLYQWITRGLAADHTLFQWLRTLYPIWAGIDEDAVRVAATGALARLARTGCTTA